MFPNFCGALGFAGWLVMLLSWTGLVAVAVWGITRLFPGPSRPEPPDRPRRQRAEHPSSLVDSGRR